MPQATPYTVLFKIIFLMVVFGVLFHFQGFSQNNGGVANWWYFGDSCSMNFNNLTPNVLNNSGLNGLACSQSISDRQGNLLFYGNQNILYDQSHFPMQNGNLTSFPSYSGYGGQPMTLIIQKPCSDDIFYYFYCEYDFQNSNQWNLKYAEIDMSLNGGFGAVTFKDSLLRSDVSPTIDATLHSNNTDYWVVSRSRNSNEFQSIEITSNGVSLNSTSSYVGSSATMITNNNEAQIRFSPNGERIAHTLINSYSISTQNRLELFNFNRSTGALIHVLDFNPPSGVTSQWFNHFEYAEFSASNRYLYSRYVAALPGNCIVQFDLQAGSNIAIANSGMLVLNTGSPYTPSSPRRGPDGKIYWTDGALSYTSLHTLNNPDATVPNCNFQPNAVFIGRPVGVGLPSFINAAIANHSITFSDSCATNTIDFSMVDTNFIDSVYWCFDTASASFTHSQTFPVQHTFNQPGSYPIEAVYFQGCNIDTVRDTIPIYPVPEADLGNDTILCQGDSLNILLNDSSFSYLWSTNANSQQIQITQPDTYWVEVSNVCGIAQDTVVVDSLIPAWVNLPQDTLLCAGDTLTLDATVAQGAYLWQDGSQDSLYTVTSGGLFYVEAQNFCGQSTDTIQVDFTQAPQLDLGVDTVLCNGDLLILDATDTLSTYLWYNGDTTSLDTVTSTGVYWAEATSLCGVDSDTIETWFLSPPTADLGNDTVICWRDTIQLSDTTFLGSYQWNTGDTSEVLNVHSAGIYILTVTNNCGSAIDTIIVEMDTVPTVDLGADTTICEGDSVQLDGTFSRSFYGWNTGSIDSVIFARIEGLYSVTTTNLCGSGSDSFYLEVDSVLVPTLGNDTILCLDDTLILSPNTPQAESYLWSDNSTADTLIVTNQNTYSVTVSNACGQFSDAIEVLYDLSPVTNLGPDSTYCLSSLIELDAAWSRAQYLWNTGSTDSTIIADTTGNYWVEVTNLCGFDDDTVRINYIVPIDFNLGNDTILCPGESITLNAPAHQANYLWSDGNTDSTLNITTNGTFSVTATNLCGSFTDQITIEYDSIPVAVLPPDTTVCEGTRIAVEVNPQNAEEILWSTGAINQQVVIDYPDTVSVTLSSHCGSSSDTMIIHHQPFPKVDLGSDTLICDEALFLINLEKLDSNVIPNYLWSTGDETESIEVNDFGTYSLTITDQWNCSDQDIINIESCGINIYIPSAFSPNGDGLNELFKVEGYGFEKFYMSVFNRWGNEIFSTQDPEQGWNGSYQNTPQSAGVYTYRIWVEQAGYDSKTFIGKVTLIR